MKPYNRDDENFNYYTIYRFFCKKPRKGHPASPEMVLKIQALFRDLHIQEVLDIYVLSTQKKKHCDMEQWIALQLWERQREFTIHSFQSIEILKKINSDVSNGIVTILNRL